MSTTVSIDGTNYEIPENGERGWGTEVSNALIALANNSLLIKGGSIPLTSEADFGANFGHKTIYYKTATADPSSTGVVRLANTDSISWRNGANSADLDLTIAADRLQYEAVDLVTLSSTDNLTNKTATSIILNTQVTGDALETDLSISALSTKLATAAAIKTYVDNVADGQNDATEITFTPTTGTDWPDPDPTTVQGALDDVAEDFTDHAAATTAHGVAGVLVGTTDAQTLTNKTLTSPSITTPTGIVKGDVGLGNVDNTSDATKDAAATTLTNKTVVVANNTVTTAPSGNLVATELNAALAELQADVDTRLAGSELTTHEGDTTTHGTTGDIVGTSDAQTLTNKTIDADNNTISNLAHGAEVDNPSSGVHGVTGSVVGTSDAQVITAKDIDGGTASNTSRITVPKSTTATLSGLTRKEGTVVYDTDQDKLFIDNGTDLVGIGGGLEPTPLTHTNLPLTGETGKYYLVDMSGASGDETLTLPNISTQNESVGVQIVSAHATYGLIVAADASDTVDSGTQFTLRTERDWRVANAQSASNWSLQRPSSGNGAEISDWVTFTPSWANLTQSSGQWQYRRVGSSMEINGDSILSAAVTGSINLTIPDSLTIDTTQLNVTTNRHVFGVAHYLDSGTAFGQGNVTYGGSSNIVAFSSEGPSEWNATQPHNWASSDVLSATFTVPIAEWANSGTTVTLTDLTARTKQVDNSVLNLTLVAGTGLVNVVANGICHRDSNDKYRFEFEASFGHDSIGEVRISMAGLSVDNTNPWVALFTDFSGDSNYCRFDTSANNIIIGTATNGTDKKIGGTLFLDAKPSWFDANAENSQSIDAQVDYATPTVAGIVRSPNSSVHLHTGNGFGSSSTKIRRFTTAITNTGSSITYSDSATLGGTFTINEDGVYTISYSDEFNTNGIIGISLNSSQLTSNVEATTTADALIMTNTGAADLLGCCTWTGHLSATDVIRAHAGGSGESSTPVRVRFVITQVSAT